MTENGAVELSRKRVVRLVGGWIREATPGAVVRFGEGEGRLLVAEPGDVLSMTVAARKVRRQTGVLPTPDEVLRVRSLVMNAFDHADVVGIRGSDSFSNEHKMWVGRLERAFEARLADGRKPAHVTHSLVNNQLRDGLPELLARQDQVSVVTCRDVEATVRARCGVPDVRVLQVPSQHVMRHIDGEYEAAMHDVPMWPEFYESLRANLSVRRPGEVFLVGAGLFGKDLCIRVRELGGIALDLGSCLDGMAGKVTRGRDRPEPYAPPPVG